jgi:AcrR family transcriptional regulator
MARIAKTVAKPAPTRGRPPKKPPVKRGIGRPAANGNSVGREKLLKTACDLLKVTPPNKLTRFMVAQKANVDPSLIRYYFRDRISLLAAAAERLAEQYAEKLEATQKEAEAQGATSLQARLAASVGLEVNFAHFRRLLLDELVGSGAAPARAAAAQIARRGVEVYREVLMADNGHADDDKAAMLFIAVVALSCYFPSARSIYESATGSKISQPAMTEKFRGYIAELLACGIRTETASAAAKPPARRGRKPAGG